jgi:hypothetical protein
MIVFAQTSHATQLSRGFLSQLRLQKLQDRHFGGAEIDCLALERFVGFAFQTFDNISVEITFEHNRIDVTLLTNCRRVPKYFCDRRIAFLMFALACFFVSNVPASFRAIAARTVPAQVRISLAVKSFP